MAKKLVSYRLCDETLANIKKLSEYYKINQTDVITASVDLALEQMYYDSIINHSRSVNNAKTEIL